MTRFRTLLFLLLFPLPALALVGPPVPIGFTEPLRGNGIDRTPSIATNGDQFFVVWEETRNRNVIRGARLDGDGTVLDPDGILISTDGDTPAVAWNGYAWAITWFTGNIGYMGRLYGTDGQPLGPPIAVSWSYEHSSTLEVGNERIATLLHGSHILLMNRELYGVTEIPLPGVSGYTSIATDGNDFLVASTATTAIALTRLDGDGNTLGTSTIPGHPAIGPIQAVWSGNHYWVVWIEQNTAYAATVSAEGVAGTPVAIAPSHDFGLMLSALTDGSAIAYVNATGTIAVRLSASGSVTSTPIAMSLPKVAANARGEMVGVWIDGAIRSAQFRPDGAPVDDGQFLVRTPPSSSLPAVDPNGISPLVVFRVDRGATRDLVVRDPNGGAPQVVASGIDSFAAPAIAGNGTSTLTTWTSCSNGACTTIGAALLSPNASPKLLSLATRNSVGGAKVVWTGSVNAVIWSEPPTLPADPGPGLWMVRVSAAGDVLDSSPVRLAAGPYGTYMLHTAVTGDGVTLVSWDETFTFCNCRTGYPHSLRALRLDQAGNPIDSAPFMLASSFTGSYDLSSPAEAWDGIGFTVVWKRISVIDGVRVLPSGFVSPFLTSTIRTTAPPMLAANGRELFLAWGDMKSRVLTGTIDANGSVIDTGGIEAPFTFDWNLALGRLGGDGVVLLSKEVLPDQTGTIMLRTINSGRPAAHRRSS